MYFYDHLATFPFFGGAASIEFAPYILSSENWRMKTWMKTGSSFLVYIHEIFHNFEAIYKITPTHGYFENNKSKWPKWFQTEVRKNKNNAEISYYDGRFK